MVLKGHSMLQLTETKKQVIRYLFIGIVNNVFYYAAFIFCTYYLNLHYSISVSVAYPLSILTGYGFNTKFTFSIENFELFSFIKYAMVYATSFSINWAILYLLIDGYGVESAIAQLAGTAVVAIFNFVCLKFIVYSKSQERNN